METAFETSNGAHMLRPWMLPHRVDYGCRGTADVVHGIVYSGNFLVFDSSYYSSVVPLVWTDVSSVCSPPR